MKYSRIILPVVVLFLQTSFGQSFINLDFENATVAPPPPDYTPFDAFDPISAANALPGWTVREDGTICSAVWGAPVALDETSVALVSPRDSPILGSYSVELSAMADATPGFFQNSSISQTGLIPLGTQSIRFLIAHRNPNLSPQSDPILTIDGAPISLSTISQSRGVFTMAGDVSAFAGSTATISFLCQATRGAGLPENENLFNLDDIQFSAQPVPEPPTFPLFAVALVVWCFRKILWLPSPIQNPKSKIQNPNRLIFWSLQ